MLQLSEKQKCALSAVGHILIQGGPGSGKTTIALLKAKTIVESGVLKEGQSVLFLSFARSTIARVEQQSKIMIDRDTRKKTEITTYHSFIWSILRSHGYLLNEKKLKILLPHEASVALSAFKNANERSVESHRLFTDEGLIHFDLFAQKCNELLSQSKKLSEIISSAYPYIILDEFQDTNEDEWNLIRTLGKHSTLIALADPDQRVYDFRGADPARIGQYIEHVSPDVFDFEIENYRSNGTDIVEFGNDILTGRNLGKKYQDVSVCTYDMRKGNSQLLDIKWFLCKRIEKLSKERPGDWSIAVLVPSNELMIKISDMLNRTKNKKGKAELSIKHEVALESSGPVLSAILIAQLLELGSQGICDFTYVVERLNEHILGQKGDKPPTKSDAKLAVALKNYIANEKFDRPIRGSLRQKVIGESIRISEAANAIDYSGDVANDWKAIRALLAVSEVDCIKQVHIDSNYIDLLQKGTTLNSELGQRWRRNGNYLGATDAVRSALVQEHFANSLKVWRGVNLMTIHKSKGKEFDEVLVYEGCFDGRFIFREETDKARINLRVAVTRARKKVYIATPKSDPCPLLISQKILP